VLELELLGFELLPLAPELMPELLGDAVLPLDALPFGQSAPVQFDEPEPAEVLPVAVAELLVLPDAEPLELGVDGVLVDVPVVAPAEVPAPVLLPLPALLPLCAHAVHSNAAATAALRPLRTIWFLLCVDQGTTEDAASKRSARPVE
jgi:hypothetical protein